MTRYLENTASISSTALNASFKPALVDR